MDWLEFISKTFWPIVVLIVLFRFRSDISGLLQRISKLKGLGFETEIREGLNEASRTADKVNIPAIPSAHLALPSPTSTSIPCNPNHNNDDITQEFRDALMFRLPSDAI